MSEPDDFRGKLTHVLAAANLSRTRLSKLVGVDKSVVSRWVSGATRPSDVNLEALTQSLQAHVPALRLTDWSRPMPDFVRAVGGSLPGLPVHDAAVTHLAARLRLPRPSVAVMPFKDLSGTQAGRLFSDGLADELITALARVSGLRVIGRSSTFAHRDLPVSQVEVARALSTDYLVQAQVQRSGERVRITVQLVDANEAVTIWADRFEQHLVDLFAAQDEIIRCVCARIDTNVFLNQATLLRDGRAQNWKTSERLRAARALLYGLDRKAFEAVRSLAEPVLAAEPDNAFALWLLGSVDWHEAWLALAPDCTASYARALARTRRAIEIDPYDEYAYATCGVCLKTMGDFNDAIAHMQRALELSPNCSLAVGGMGTVLIWAGKPDEGITYQQLSLQSDPHNPSNFFRHLGLGIAHYLKDDWAGARVWLQLALSRRPEWPAPRIVLAAVERCMGLANEAAATLARALAVAPGCLDEQALHAAFPFRHARDFGRLLEHVREIASIACPAEPTAGKPSA
jgi:TolB-like protein